MTEGEVEPVLLDAVRRHTGNDAVTAQSRFQQDLRLSDAGRQMLFASLAQTFTARGVSLASHGFLMRDFLACATPAEAREAIVGKVFGKAVLPSRVKSAAPPAVAPVTSAVEVAPTKGAASTKPQATAKRKPSAKKPAPKKPKAAAKRTRR